MGGIRWAGVLAVAVLLAACESGGSTSASTSTTVAGPVTSVERDGEVAVRLTLDHGSVPSGGTVTGTVTMDNRTGAPIDGIKCGEPFAVWLGRPGAWPDVAYPTCAEQWTVPTGRSDYPVKLIAEWASCRSSADPKSVIPSCDGGGTEQDLVQPPGRYLARLFGPGVVVLPPDIPFTVTAAKG